MVELVTDDAIKSLKLGKDVYDDITYCLSQWQEAGKSAVIALIEPKDDDATLDWVISFIGNMAWAATVFFAPELIAVEVSAGVTRVGVTRIGEMPLRPHTIPTASKATQAVSMIGAGMAAGLVPQVRQIFSAPKSDLAKATIKRHLGAQIPILEKGYVAEADAWVKATLNQSLVEAWKKVAKPEDGKNHDGEFVTYYSSAVGGKERRKTVWERYIFKSDELAYDKGQQGLEDYLSTRVQTMRDSFEDQWHRYMRSIPTKVELVRGRFTLPVPNTEWVAAHPFDPEFTFKGIPDDVQAKQRANRRALHKLVHLSLDDD